MRALIAEAKKGETGDSSPTGPTMDGDGTISVITYKELQQHLQRSAGQVPVASH